jgi:hypothetical protein
MTSAAGGSAGGIGSAAASGPGPGVAPSAPTGDGVKATRVEVIDVGGQSLGEFGQDGKPVAPAAAFRQGAGELDRAEARAIERNADALADKRDRGTLTAADQRDLAQQDAKSLGAIQDPTERRFAAVAVGENARDHAEYREALQRTAPQVAREAETAAQENERRTAEKDGRKAAEFESMQLAKAERAQAWTPEQAADQARKDIAALREADRSERHHAAADMAVAAEHSKAYRGALAKEAPDVAAEVEARRARPDVAAPAANDGMAPRGPAANEPMQRESLVIDPFTQARLADTRARDRNSAAAEMGLNGIEPSTKREAQVMDEAGEDKRSAWLRKGQEAQQAEQGGKGAAPKQAGNQVESDEVFTASHADVKPVVPADIEKRYLRVGDKFYHPNNTEVVAFEDKGNRLETRSNSEAVAETMVHIAKARGWDEIKASGSETFRREVWLEAAASGMNVKGYTPSEQDKAELAKRLRDTPTNTVQDDKRFRARETEAAQETTKPAQQTSEQRRAQAFADRPPAEVVREHPELAGAYAAAAATDRKAEADGLTPEQRAIVAARVRQNLVNAIERGDAPQMAVREEREVERRREAEASKEATR